MSHVPPVVLVTGSKDSGKTTLVVELIRRLARPGRAVLAFKHATNIERVDQPGTDTMRFAAAGATVTGLTWPGGTYVAYFAPVVDPSAPGGSPQPAAGGAPSPAATRQLMRQASLEEIVGLALALTPDCGNTVVLAEGFSDTDYPRLHVLPRPGRPERHATGPVLGVWALEVGEAGSIAELVDINLPLLGRWAEEVQAAQSGHRPMLAGTTVAAILAGGRGRRLGGLDKWTMEVAGRRQSDRSLGALAGLFDRILVVGREPEPGGASQAAGTPEVAGATAADRPGPRPEWLPDALPGQGPLGGLLAALIAAAGRDVFAFAGDMPLLSRALILHMLFVAWRRSGSFDVLLPVWSPNGSGTFSEPLHAIYRPECRTHLEDLAAREGLAGRRLTEAFTGLRLARLPESEIRLFGDPATLFLNLNTPADLARAEAILRS